MADITIGDKTYSLGFTMLSVVRSKALTGKGFFELANKQEVGQGEDKIDAETAMEKVLDLLLLALQTNHAGEFKSIEDVARAFPSMMDIGKTTAVVNQALMQFMAVDKSLKKQMLEAQNAARKNGAKKKARRSKTSPKTNTPQSVESDSG
jgi:hypothetical protein